MGSTPLSSLLKNELQIRYNRELQIGNLTLVVIAEPRKCEGICSEESYEEYMSDDHPPMSPDYVVRRFCRPKTLQFGEIALRQTKKSGVDFPIDQICCLDCALQSGVIRVVSGS